MEPGASAHVEQDAENTAARLVRDIAIMAPRRRRPRWKWRMRREQRKRAEAA